MRHLYLSIAWLCLVLGFIGAFLPVLPTTPFLILASLIFSKHSKRLHLWLTSLPHFGDAIIDWEENKVIRLKAKVLSSVCIVLTFSYSLGFTSIPIALKIMLGLIAVIVLCFILTRRSELE